MTAVIIFVIVVILITLALELYSLYLKREIEKSKEEIQKILVELYGGPYDGKTIRVPKDCDTIMMPDEVEARLIAEDDKPDEMKPHIYKRT